ncbi:MAG: hypothetical protein KIT66_08415 [Chitinophagaceae bacterium]|nr:hypothetical protein [Chitinophagaceae bacterium]MCZ2395275.1 hypothetical protein [Chitinophagales bacterium]
MRSQIWEKYIPVIKILLKKAASGPQMLELNRIDFEGAGIRKTGFKFKIEFRNGKVENIISSAPLATALATEMMNNEQIGEILREGDYTISLNPKYELTIKAG